MINKGTEITFYFVYVNVNRFNANPMNIINLYLFISICKMVLSVSLSSIFDLANHVPWIIV